LSHAEWCIRQLWSSSIIIRNTTIIAHDQYTNINPLLNIYTYVSMYVQRNLNSLQRRAVKVDPAATTRCLICVKPISLPPQPQDLPSQQPQSNSTQSTDGSNNSNNSNGSASQGEDKNRTRERRRQERQRKGGLSSGVLSGGGGTIWGRPLSEAAQPTGVLIFANKQVYHRSCYLAQQQQQ